MLDTFDLLLFRFLWEQSKNNITYNEPIKNKKKKENKKYKQIKDKEENKIEDKEEVERIEEDKEEDKIEELIKFKPNIVFYVITPNTILMLCISHYYQVIIYMIYI